MDSLVFRLNKIDDNKSLKMRTRVESCKNRTHLKEAVRKTVNVVEFTATLEKVVKEIIRTLPFDISFQKLEGSVTREERPVRYNYRGHADVTPGANAAPRSGDFDSRDAKQIKIELRDIPTNCPITETLLMEKYKDEISKPFFDMWVPPQEAEWKESLYQLQERNLFRVMDSIESKYNVTLDGWLFPDMEKFCQNKGTYGQIQVEVRAISGKSGRLSNGVYVINGKGVPVNTRLTTFRLASPDLYNYEIAGEEWSLAYVLKKFIAKIDNIDHAVKNKPELEKQLNEYLTKLQRYYRDTTLSTRWNDDIGCLGGFEIIYDATSAIIAKVHLETLAKFDEATEEIRKELRAYAHL